MQRYELMSTRSTLTIKDVAHAAGVSASTVSRVLNSNVPVSPDLRRRVLEAVETLGYRPSISARSLRTRQTHTIGLILPDVTLPYFAEIAFGAEDAAIKRGYSILLCNSREDAERERRYFNLLTQKWVDGLIFSAVERPEDLLDMVLGHGIHAVQIDRVYDELSIHSVRIDNVQASSLATRYLLDCGHRRIFYFMGPASVRPFIGRLEGYRRALAEAGIAFTPDWVYKVEDFETPLQLAEANGSLWQRWASFSFSFYVAFGYQASQKLLAQTEELPTAIFAANDAIAIGTIRGLEAGGLVVPDDISVMGFDDVSYASLVKPALTTIAQPKYELGAKAVDLVIEAAQATDPLPPRHITLEVDLVVRDSTATLNSC
ncbi:MAG TPA: LacI family transcriptional regulator [Chloroflexi bacterium]|nr:LacI family transcriptional regulator [Chloroflexota bacterium]